MKILAIGLNHRTADVEIRERLAFNGSMVEEGIFGLKKLSEVKEVALLSTCNRVEIYSHVDTATASAVEGIKNFISAFHGIQRDVFEKSLYIRAESDAIRHILMVASSLDSMVVGEPQILGQFKEAFDFALTKKTTGVLLNRLMRKAISTAKRVRTETRIAENAVSVGFAAVELAKKIFGGLSGKSCMLLGAGEMAELTARCIVRSGAKDVVVVNRTYERCCELAEEFGGRPARFEDFLQEIVHMDIIICSTGAPDYVLNKEEMKAVMKKRRHKPVFIIDISVPRNIDPKINRIGNVYLYDIDDLQGVADSNLFERKKEVEKAERIVDEEVEKFIKWVPSLNSVPVIVEMRQKAERIKEKEIRKFRNKFPDLDGEKMRSVQQMATSIINELLHPPTVALKEEVVDRDELVSVIQRLYGLNGHENGK
ncbi:glutamyl-tRNA reductase [Thermodesulfovibrionales bacterium]|nr:glutamyl-tRNA reductase [Thermodesulfovibrionales bacterium]